MFIPINIGSEKLARGLVSLLTIVSSVILFVMMITVFIDVVSRYVFNLPVKGSNELISLYLACTVFLCIPVITYRLKHIKVALLENYFSTQFKAGVVFISYLIMAGGLWAISDKILIWADRFALRNQKTLFWELPLTWFAYLALASCYITILLLILRILHTKKATP